MLHVTERLKGKIRNFRDGPPPTGAQKLVAFRDRHRDIATYELPRTNRLSVKNL